MSPTQTNNTKLYAESEQLLRRLRSSPKLWDDDSAKIDRVLLKAKARMLRRRDLTGVPRYQPGDWMLNTFA